PARALPGACDVFSPPGGTDSAGVAEGSPPVPAEAMAFGKPVITTRHVEIPRIVEEILVDENDVGGLRDAIDRVARSASLRAELAARNRCIARIYFSRRNAEKTLHILRSLARTPSRFPTDGREVTNERRIDWQAGSSPERVAGR